MAEPIRVFLADDHALVREGLAALLSKAPEIDVVGQCGDGLRIFSEVSRTHPDVVLLDLALPGQHGLDVCRQITRHCKGVAVLVVTMYSEEEFVLRALRNGASGYLIKDAAASRLVEAIHTVARNAIYLGPGVPTGVLNRLGESRKDDPYNALTPRERQVLKLIAEGKTNRQCAELLGIAVKTVETHRAHVMKKLDIHNQTGLVRFAIRRGLIQE